MVTCRILHCKFVHLQGLY